jgi:transketolase
MALAPLIYTIWNRVLHFDPQDPIWPNRDRFVLSNGHASMLLWSALHLTGVQAVNANYESVGKPSVTLDDICHFRQLNSKAPGHPEYHWVSGVETTTGPLGQGVATSVGMAIAEKWLAHRYPRRKPHHWRVIWVSTIFAGFSTTTTSRLRDTPDSHSLKTWRRDSMPMDGTF